MTGRPLRFLVAGGVNTLFGIAIYPALIRGVPVLGRHYLVALGLAQGLSVVFAYLVYKIAVFRTRANVVREFSAFSTFYLLNYAANWAALPLLVEGAHLSPIVAQFGFIAVTIVGSWFWHSRLTFRTLRAANDR